jgi:hypothetical protein
MGTISDLQAMRDALVKARARGTREVQDSNGKRVQYSSDAEMASAIAFFDREIAKLGTPIRSVYLTTSKGV